MMISHSCRGFSLQPRRIGRLPLLGPILLFLVVSALAAQASAAGVSYYVDPVHGNDSANGLTEETAVRTINRAAQRVNPGDTVYLRGGVHNRSPFPLPTFALCFVSRDGTPEAPITYTNYPGETPIVSTVGINNDMASSFGSAFHINASHVIFRGLTIQGNTSVVSLDDVLAVEDKLTAEISAIDPHLARTRVQYGFSLFRYGGKVGSHITIENCVIRDCTGAGIAVSNDTDYVTIRNNVVHDNLTRNNQGTSAINLITLTGQLTAPAGETRIVIENNRIYNNENKLRWARNVTVNGVVERRVTYSDGNGIIVDQSGSYTGRILIRNNLIYNNGGFGVALTSARNVDVFNNTTYRNGKGPGLIDTPAYGEISNTGNATLTATHRIQNNIFWLRDGKNQTNGVVNDVVAANNLFWRDSGGTFGARGPGTIGADPQFLQVPSSDTDPEASFLLHPTSPAIDSGLVLGAVPVDFDGLPRPQGNGQDRGAYESVPRAPTALTVSDLTDTTFTLGWTAPPAPPTSYVLQQQIDEDTWSDVTVIDGNAISFPLTGLSPESDYVFRLIANYAYSDSLPSAAVDVRTLIRLDALVARDGLATFPYPQTEPGKRETGLSLTSLGRLQVDGAVVATVWRIRNASQEVREATLSGNGVNFLLPVTLPPQTDTFLVSPIVADDATHRLVYQGVTIDVKASSYSIYSDDRLVDTSIP